MSVETEGPSERLLTALGVGSGVMQLVVFTAVGVMTLDSVPYGLATGTLSGVGAFLFLPWFISLSTVQEESDAGLAAAAGRISRSTGPGVVGLGLELGAITMLAIGFVVDSPSLPLGVASGLVVAVGTYLVGSFALGR
jgi:hypothetical protein